MRSEVGLSVFILLLAPHAAAWGWGPSAAVSPGSPAGSQVGDVCPTFSWSGTEGATGYEIVLYDLDAEERSDELSLPLQGRSPRLHRRLAGLVLSWTPSFEECLESGGRYAWAVRALRPGETEAWSEPALFTVVGRPSVAEVERALEVLREYLGSEGRSEARGVEGRPQPGSQSESAGGGLVPRASGPDFIKEAGLSVTYESNSVTEFITAAAELFNGAATAPGAGGAHYGLYAERRRPAGSAEGGAAVLAQNSSSFAVVAEDSGHVLRAYGGICCNGFDLLDYVALIQNHTSTGDSDVLALSTRTPTPGPASNFIGFFAPPSVEGADTLIGEIEADGQGGVNYRGGHLTLVPTDLPMACSAASHEGRIYFDDSLSEPCYCDGASWKQLDGGGAC